jgi:hypothetical protein
LNAPKVGLATGGATGGAIVAEAEGLGTGLGATGNVTTGSKDVFFLSGTFSAQTCVAIASPTAVAAKTLVLVFMCFPIPPLRRLTNPSDVLTAVLIPTVKGEGVTSLHKVGPFLFVIVLQNLKPKLSL